MMFGAGIHHGDPGRKESAAVDVRVEQISLLYGNLSASIAANILIGGCVAFSVVGKVQDGRLALWLAMLFVALIARTTLHLIVRRRPVGPDTVLVREVLFTAGACATGLVWGLSFPVLGLSSIPESDRWFTFTVVIVSGAGIASAGVFTMAYRIWPPRLFVGVILLPAFVFFVTGDVREQSVAALILVFLAFLYRSAATTYAVTRNNLLLRGEAMASEELYHLLFERSPLPMWVYEEGSRKFLTVNQRAVEHYGFARDEFARMTLDDLRPAGGGLDPNLAASDLSRGDASAEWRHKTKDGTIIDVAIRSTPMAYGALPARMALIQDITERKQFEQREQSRRRVMELLTDGAPLTTILEAVVHGVEQGNPAMLCSILQLDAAGKRLRIGAAPSLPAYFNAAIDGLGIGIGAGSCGTAAFTGKRVIVEDVRTHPYWAQLREIAGKAGLRACWSEPIRATSGKVLGTFAIYHREAHQATDAEIHSVRPFVDLAGLALERSLAAEALRASEARFRSLTQLGADWYWEQDEQFRFTELSAGIYDHAGISPESSIGKTSWELEPVDTKAAVWQRHREQLARHEPFRNFEMERRNDKGNVRIISISGEPVFDAAGTFTGYRGVGTDITERKRMEADLQELATTDSLTGLANRRHFLDRLDNELARLRRIGDQPVAVLMLDLDHFKRVNDIYGHATGDAVLRHFAALLRDEARKIDIGGRVGGEEFAIILPGADPAAARVFAERLRHKVAITPFVRDGQSITVTVSIGIAAMNPTDASVDAALDRADEALYRAKQGGRNRVEEQSCVSRSGNDRANG